MCIEAKHECKNEGLGEGFGCCPEDFHKVFSTMSNCCTDKSRLKDCGDMMSRMKDLCGGQERAKGTT
jgi:hypothetical protein